MKYIGLDVGNGSTAVCSRKQHGQLVKHVFPSVFGSYEERRNISLDGRNIQRVNTYRLGDRDYVLGMDVRLTGATPVQAYDREDRYRRPEYKTLSNLALLHGATMDGVTGPIEVELGIGVPAEDYRSAVVQELQNRYKQPIVAEKNGDRVEVHVRRVEVASQPIAVFMDRYLDSHGYVRDESLESKRVLVIDSGSGTLDLSEFDGMNLVKQASEGTGMNDVYQTIIDAIRKNEPKVRADVFELEWQLRNQDELSQKTFSYGRFSMDITKVHSNAMQDVWERMVGAISLHFPDRMRFNRVILAGGTGQAFTEYFRKWMPDIEIPEQPSLSIARGLFKQVLANTESL